MAPASRSGRRPVHSEAVSSPRYQGSSSSGIGWSITVSDGVFAASGGEGIAEAAGAALAYRADAGTVARFRAENDWTARLEAAGLFAV